MFTIWYSLGLVAGVAIVAAIYHVVFQLWFHPLAGHPGPLLGKITNLYAGWHQWRGDIHVDMYRCHEKYGKFVRYAPNRLLVNTNTGLRDIYGYGKNVQKSVAYKAMVHRAPNTLTLIDKKAHGKRRRIISQGLGDAALRKYQPTILARVQGLCHVVRRHCSSEEWSRPVNMADYFSYMSFDIMSNTIFGEDYDLLGAEKYRHVVKDIDASNVRTSVLIQAPVFSSFRADRHLFKASIRGRNRFLGFLATLLKARYSRPKTDGTDVFSFLTNAKDPDTGERLRGSEIGAESATLIIAGSDTSSTALCGVFFYLAHYPTACRRVTEEVRNAFATPEEITLGASLTSCTYLRACIEESLRLSPPAGGALWREVAAEGGVFDGVRLPAGVDIAVCVYAIHHNVAYYPQPFTFRPERWLAKGGEAELAQSAFNPFSVGPRSCIGKGFAMAELLLACARILWEFDIRPDDQHADKTQVPEFYLRDHITGIKEGPVLQFRARTTVS